MPGFVLCWIRKRKEKWFMEYCIRPVTAEDAGALHALRLTPGVMENLLGIPSWRLDQARGWLDGLGSDSHEFAAVTPEGRVVGEAGLSGCSRPRIKHVGSLGMMSTRSSGARGWARP